MMRVMLYVQSPALLKDFYQSHFGLGLREEIPNEWVLLDAGGVEIVKLVFRVDSGIEDLRTRMAQAGVVMRELKRYDGFGYLMCDGSDPEGNVFQLLQPD